MLPGLAPLAAGVTLDFALNAPDATVVAAYRGDSYTAGSWPDRTGNGYEVSQGTAGNQPAAIADGGGDFKNQPIVRFDGSNDYLTRSSTPAISQPITSIIVFKTSFTTRQAIIAEVDNVGWFCATETYPYSFAGTTRIGSTNVMGAAHCVEYYFNGGSSTNYVDGVEDPLPGSPGTTGVSGIIVGNQSNLGFPFTGDIAEIILCSTGLTTDDRNYLAQYVNQRYGIALP